MRRAPSSTGLHVLSLNGSFTLVIRTVSGSEEAITPFFGAVPKPRRAPSRLFRDPGHPAMHSETVLSGSSGVTRPPIGGCLLWTNLYSYDDSVYQKQGYFDFEQIQVSLNIFCCSVPRFCSSSVNNSSLRLVNFQLKTH